MQVSNVLLLTVAILSLLSTAIKSSPILPMGDDADLTAFEQDKEFKRICGMSYYCRRFKVKKKKKNTFFLFPHLIFQVQ